MLTKQISFMPRPKLLLIEYMLKMILSSCGVSLFNKNLGIISSLLNRFTVAPMAPHGQFVIGTDGSVTTSPPIPAARHANLFKEVKSKYYTLPSH